MFILDAGQLAQFLRFENQHNNCWFNALLQMLLTSGNIADTVRRSGDIDIDLMSNTVITITSTLKSLVKRQENENTQSTKNIVNDSFIMDHIAYLRVGGLNFRSGRQNCLFDFFDSAIAPTLSHHALNYKLMMKFL